MIPGFTADNSLYESPSTYRSSDSSSIRDVTPQAWWDPSGCTFRCISKSGFAACVARCQLDNKACDGGLHNCD